MKIKQSAMIITAIAALGFVSHGIAAKLKAAADVGYHILYQVPAYYAYQPPTWQTKNPAACPGITFPSTITGPISPHTITSPNPANRINFSAGVVVGQWCSTTYRSSIPGYHCTVSVKVKKIVGGVYDVKINTQSPSCSYTAPNVILNIANS